MSPTNPLIADHSIDEEIRRLISVRHFATGNVITLPVMYPSGASVALEVIQREGRCFVSDMGRAHGEAEMMGALRYFKATAEDVAERFGVGYDGHMMFVAEAPFDQIRGAITVVANASAEAAKLTAMKIAERGEADTQDELYERLRSIYKSKDVQKDAELVGTSNHKWRISILVHDRERQWMFEPVVGKYISVVGTTAKFQDFLGVENPPLRFAIVKSQEDLGDYYGLITRASTKVIPMSAPDSTFAQLLKAA